MIINKKCHYKKVGVKGLDTISHSESKNENRFHELNWLHLKGIEVDVVTLISTIGFQSKAFQQSPYCFFATKSDPDISQIYFVKMSQFSTISIEYNK